MDPTALRHERVARLRAAYEAGTYRADPRAVAAAVLRLAPHEVLQ
ncbi:MAG TPA: flagellar biosynthesis anti-sigma factor FlgM [Candidatus Binatia bacterium]|nr:flagellar biosynthesis anti-sigma factor FlgM [Candidatus Binatia bacterium]